VLADIAAHKVTTMFGVPAMFLFMAQDPSFAETDLSSVRLLCVGGAPCPLPVLKTYLARGVSMQQGYGLTETSPMVSFLAPEYALTKVGSSGRTPMFVEVKIIDSDGRAIETPRAQGEILVRGANVTKGYWGLPDATAKAIDADGWFHTGDAGFLDEEGFLTISDRIKDMIISGGENVYPAEIESCLMRHPAIAEVGVIGEPDVHWGERVVAVAALKPGASLTLEELRAFAEPSLAHFKLPKRLEIVSALPRNATGKILKHQLRHTFAKAGAAAAQ
jgi:fatty-acyl-CoA synthase